MHRGDAAGPSGPAAPATAVRARAASHRSPLPSPVAAPWPPPAACGLTAAEARALIAASSPIVPTGVRNRALLAMMYRSGLRPGEVLALMPRDLDAVAGTVAVRTGRRPASRRTTGVDATTRRLVSAWLEVRRAGGAPADGPLFCTLAGAPLTGAYLRQLTSRLARRAGVSARAHPMGLRHAGAVELAEEGVPAPLIDRHLGLAAAWTPRGGRAVGQAQLVHAIAARGWEVPGGAAPAA